MKKKFTGTPLTDEHLKSLEGIKEPETNPFFYTQLKAKMERKQGAQGWVLPFRPAWVITMLTLFLVVNGFIVFKQLRASGDVATEVSSLQNFVNTYNLSISPSY